MKNVNIRLGVGTIVLGAIAMVTWTGVKIATLVSTVRAQKKLLRFIDNYTDGCMNKMKEIMELE